MAHDPHAVDLDKCIQTVTLKKKKKTILTMWPCNLSLYFKMRWQMILSTWINLCIRY